MYEYDDAGRMVRSVTRQIEPEYDESTRTMVEGLRVYDLDCCSGCGTHRSIADNLDEHHFMFEERVCPVCVEQAKYARIQAERDDEQTPKGTNGVPRWDSPRTQRPTDGRHTFLRRMSPEEVAERATERDPNRRA